MEEYEEKRRHHSVEWLQSIWKGMDRSRPMMSLIRNVLCLILMGPQTCGNQLGEADDSSVKTSEKGNWCRDAGRRWKEEEKWWKKETKKTDNCDKNPCACTALCALHSNHKIVPCPCLSTVPNMIGFLQRKWAAKALTKLTQRKEDVQTRKWLTLERGRARAGQEAVVIMLTILVETGEGEGDAIWTKGTAIHLLKNESGEVGKR